MEVGRSKYFLLSQYLNNFDINFIKKNSENLKIICYLCQNFHKIKNLQIWIVRFKPHTLKIQELKTKIV